MILSNSFKQSGFLFQYNTIFIDGSDCRHGDVKPANIQIWIDWNGNFILLVRESKNNPIVDLIHLRLCLYMSEKM